MSVKKMGKVKQRKPKTPNATRDVPKRPLTSTRFKPGNQLWKQRTKHGRDYLFTDPLKLWEAAEEYFQWCDNNPLERNEVIKYEGEMSVEAVEVGRPYTLTGLCFWINCSENYFRQLDRTKASVELLTVVDNIEKVIREQQLGGAMVNIFNGPIASKLQDLVDRTDVTTGGKEISMPEMKIYTTAPPFAGGEKDLDTKRKKDA